MERATGRIDPQKAYLNPTLIVRGQLQAGKNVKDYASQLGIDYRTLRDIIEGRGVLFTTAKAIAAKLREDADVLKFLAPWDPRYEPSASDSVMWSPFTDWEPKQNLEQGRLAPNGLYYMTCRMEHRHTAGKLGRGKFYHLFWLRPDLRDQSHHLLCRHADICARVGLHPNLAVNLTSTPVAQDQAWWVIDDWVGARTLADCLPWPKERLPRLLLEIARGLDALHNAGVVFRELAPTRVLVSDRDGRAVLTDFELAKLLDGARSVSADEWPEDPFRADEIGNGTATVQADLFSLAMTAAAAISGAPFDRGRVVDILEAAELPRRLCRLLVQSSHPVPDQRPAELSPLVKELTRWAEK